MSNSAPGQVETSAPVSRASSPFHIMTKPMGPLCNLDCQYCFYLEKEGLFPSNERFKMNPELLETYIRDYIAAQPGQSVSFAWQGGEPTLAGVDFFRKVVELQRKYAAGRQIENALQTNGTLLNDEWCRFLAGEGFLVGISIDGPERLHDAGRVDKRGQSSYRQVIRGIELARKHKVEFNTLTVVSSSNVGEPLEVYKFLRNIGSNYLQFIPLVERAADEASAKLGLSLGLPPDFDNPPAPHQPIVTKWTVDSRAWGQFLCKIFDRWVTRDVGRTFVQQFDVALGKWLGMPGGTCVFSETCGKAFALEHNGDLYACDHYVYPRYKLGNILNQSIAELADSAAARKFGNDKRDKLTRYCRECEVRFACNGDCPKHRFTFTPEGEFGLSHLCAGYKLFFHHIDPAMKLMADLYRNRRPSSDIMAILKRQPGLLKKA
ncbi:anaerobic sulfatase maturase [Ruficoccus amylovorans]|uniref:Anaerobic sulfatase maturase n=1 Tax=Ruficoccus amylovorans TaxID=1804625 RepID=A0A842HDR7_9BACT|nr:anaerobic sulfatase maturase [Ruficoccus amylovorans]MBC2593727.1 anaerobic sulfatase maturase [Ruficoccus amylovorans]